ncbi:23S rRNA (pseudouridine(1915)-N(3))-methyltransferase RlmH [Inmirania thermothiophila]|uniref:Ribosomal RNA large subunit methyltransferase H n=1 Tax=Inmirania thermothiophila TaxID=1750597 RepID=A0A3N1Y8P6_9GAMM|nr:23S rRNA (pseudouridine(1915)-N(3))-methyltransferase RlmH [Inmirania thermothiophila]ROR34868.1 23S rRNA (pseudouridine1915-N3)-methyltransferase [Inmirania thermothiophila]
MRVHLLSVAARVPSWVAEGYRDYARRLGRGLELRLREIRPAGGEPARARAEEGRRLLAAVPRGARLVALDERGELWDTRGLARRLAAWAAEGRDLALAVGGAEGLDGAVLGQAELRWSLSPLTLPHALVRVIVAEQLYRAWSLLGGHPYHRG